MPSPRPDSGAPEPLRLVVVGGGISGLSAARAAVETVATARPKLGSRDARVEVIVLEREAFVGGKARTHKRDGYLLEGGPTGFLDNEPVLDRLVEVAGLTKLPADEAAARRFLVRGGRLREVQPHPLRFARSGILSPIGLLRIAREAFIPKKADDEDESVWSFAQRRLGAQAADRMIAPMVLGVFAGDAKQLSLAAAFPRMQELEREYGSLFRAMKALKAARRSEVAAAGGPSGGPAGPGAALTSFADGLQSFPRALADRGGFTVRTSHVVTGMAARRSKWELRLRGDDQPLHADAVILATEPWAAADVLPSALSPAAMLLAGIECPPVAVVGLGFRGNALARVPRGFGALIPRGEGFRILGVLWDTHLFPGRSPEGTLLVRAMLGGAVDPEVGSLEAAELVAIARADLRRLLAIKEEPAFQEVVPWPRAIPQYTLGHVGRVERITGAIDAWNAGGGPLLGLAGNALEGVAFGKAAALGWRVGTHVAEQLAQRSTREERPQP